MQSSVIRKMEKARRYAEQRERVAISSIKVAFHGNHSEHHVTFSDGEWACSCDFFFGYETCSHTMALERILDPMLTESKPQHPLGYLSS